jgi:hypothetical protein
MNDHIAIAVRGDGILENYKLLLNLSCYFGRCLPNEYIDFAAQTKLWKVDAGLD